MQQHQHSVTKFLFGFSFTLATFLHRRLQNEGEKICTRYVCHEKTQTFNSNIITRSRSFRSSEQKAQQLRTTEKSCKLCFDYAHSKLAMRWRGINETWERVLHSTLKIRKRGGAILRSHTVSPQSWLKINAFWKKFQMERPQRGMRNEQPPWRTIRTKFTITIFPFLQHTVRCCENREFTNGKQSSRRLHNTSS